MDEVHQDITIASLVSCMDSVGTHIEGDGTGKVRLMKVKTDNCNHSYKEECNKCIDFETVGAKLWVEVEKERGKNEK